MSEGDLSQLFSVSFPSVSAVLSISIQTLSAWSAILTMVVSPSSKISFSSMAAVTVSSRSVFSFSLSFPIIGAISPALSPHGCSL